MKYFDMKNRLKNRARGQIPGGGTDEFTHSSDVRSRNLPDRSESELAARNFALVSHFDSSLNEHEFRRRRRIKESVNGLIDFSFRLRHVLASHLAECLSSNWGEEDLESPGWQFDRFRILGQIFRSYFRTGPIFNPMLKLYVLYIPFKWHLRPALGPNKSYSPP